MKTTTNEDDPKWRRLENEDDQRWKWPKMNMTNIEDDKNEDDPKWRRLENEDDWRWKRPKMNTTKIEVDKNEDDQNRARFIVWSFCVENRPTDIIDRLSEIVRLMAGALNSIVLDHLPESFIEILIKNQFIFHIRKSLKELVFKPRST